MTLHPKMAFGPPRAANASDIDNQGANRPPRRDHAADLVALIQEARRLLEGFNTGMVDSDALALEAVALGKRISWMASKCEPGLCGRNAGTTALGVADRLHLNQGDRASLENSLIRLLAHIQQVSVLLEDVLVEALDQEFLYEDAPTAGYRPGLVKQHGRALTPMRWAAKYKEVQ